MKGFLVPNDIALKASIDRALAIDNGVPMGESDAQTVSSNTSSTVDIYHVITGEKRTILRNDAPRVLNKRLSDGRPVFWMEGMPGKQPVAPVRSVRCYLDPQFDETNGVSGLSRKDIDGMGLSGRACNMMAPDKNNAMFISSFERDTHMAKKHRTEWKTIQDTVERRRREEDQKTQRMTAEAILAAISGSVKKGQ